MSTTAQREGLDAHDDASLNAAADAMPTARAEILHVREPNSSCRIRLFVDGVQVAASGIDVVNVDPGSGWTRGDWAEARPSEGSAAFLRAAQAA